MSSSTLCNGEIDTSESVEIIPAPPSQKISLSSADVSRITGMSLVHVRNLMAQGIIESVMISATRGRRHYRCSPAALSRFLADRSVRST